MCAHIDLFPTILDACDVPISSEHRIDGRSFLPLLTETDAAWPTRQLVFQTHRGDVPQLFHHFAIHEGSWKLVHPSGFGRERFVGEPKFQLYDLSKDPQQKKDLSSERPEMVQKLSQSYQAWFADVSSTRPDNYAPPRS